MNEINKTASIPVQVKSLPVAAVSSQSKGQKPGNDLPHSPEAAISSRESVKDFEAVQERLQAAVAQMNEYVQSTQRDLQFSFDPSSGETVVRVLDRNTKEVIRQIPDEIFLRLAQDISQDNPISLFSVQV